MPRDGGQSEGRGRGAHQSSPRSKSAPPAAAASKKVEHDVNVKATEELGMEVVETMTEEDMKIFLDRLATECPMNDKMAYGLRCQKVNWEKVAFGAFGEEECQAAWLYLKSGTRKFRIMAEMIQEVQTTLLNSSNAEKATYQKKLQERASGFPKKPGGIASGFQMFCVEKWAMKPADSGEKNFIVFQSECQELFKSLSKDQQDKFQHKADLAKAEYEAQVKEFYLRHPGLTTLTVTTTTKSGKLPRITNGKAKYTNVPVPPVSPHLLFTQKKLSKLNVPPTKEMKAKFKSKWANMSDKKKFKWIEKCINKSQNYLSEMDECKNSFPDYVAKDFKIRKIITKEEIKIWESFKGKPPRPILTPFDNFLKKFCEKAENASLPIEECKKLARARWKNLGTYHKKIHQVDLKKTDFEYKSALEKYYEEIPSLMKPLILENLPKKYKQGLLTSVEKVIDIPDEDSQNSIDAPKILDEYSEVEGEMETDNVGEVEPLVKKSKKRKRKHVRDEEVKEDIDVEVRPVDLDINSDNQPTKKKKKKKKKKKSGHEEDEEDSGLVKDETLGMEQSVEPLVKKSKKRKEKHFLREEQVTEDIDVQVVPEDLDINSETKKKKKRKKKSGHEEEMTENGETLGMVQGGEGDDVPVYHLYDQELNEDDRIKNKKEKKKKKVNQT